MFKLVIQDDEGKTTVVPLIRDEITIGRKEGNTIRLTERNVSRRHARILRNNGEVHIEDLGSYNGIRVNNARIAERVSLRVSDQVQIGDYKLYLKAEGVEQVDDARTMPIERLEGTGPTDVIPAVAPGQTQPLGIPHTPAGSVPQIVGTPNRPLAIADTDPQGRPVASAATVAALTSPVGYGKLVVLSSNFAGKEFELSRPQMIVGRTDENDIVINHRSISRNHAKLVREPETGRYTVSDLQSSNGVRVNGQDYGKVELRRGDVIDLGHVRLRFVEPGEDFVFARDAVITDVPDTGGRKGLLVAIMLGVIVLAAVIIVFAMKSGEKKPQAGTTPGSSGQNDGSGDDSGSQVAITPGSGIEPVTPDAAIPQVATGDPKAELNAQCLDFAARRKWAPDLYDCAQKLKKLDPALGDTYHKQATDEPRHQQSLIAMQGFVKKNNYREAAKAFAKIPATSVYYKEAESELAAFQQKTLEFYTSRAEADRNRDKTCRQWDKNLDEVAISMGKTFEKQIRDAVPCTRENVAVNPPKDPPPRDPPPKDPPKDPPVACNADAAVKAGQEHMGKGEAAAALNKFHEAYSCKPNQNTANMAFLAACVSKNSGMAKRYYNKISNQGLTQRCRDYKTDFGAQ